MRLEIVAYVTTAFNKNSMCRARCSKITRQTLNMGSSQLLVLFKGIGKIILIAMNSIQFFYLKVLISTREYPIVPVNHQRD